MAWADSARMSRLLVAQGAGEPLEDGRVDRRVGRNGRPVELVGEALEEARHRPAPLPLGVDLDEGPDRLLADLRIAVLERRDEGRHRGEVAQLPQGKHHLEPHVRLRVPHERGQRGNRRAAPALSQRPGRALACLRGGALQVGDLVFERLREGGHGERADDERQCEHTRQGAPRTAAEHVFSQQCHDGG